MPGSVMSQVLAQHPSQMVLIDDQHRSKFPGRMPMIMSQIAFAPVPAAGRPFGLATMLARWTRLSCPMTSLRHRSRRSSVHTFPAITGD